MTQRLADSSGRWILWGGIVDSGKRRDMERGKQLGRRRKKAEGRRQKTQQRRTNSWNDNGMEESKTR
ncbi:hypothetical protein BO70DRAFT_365409 [Aspergillus heteromorphus CBS 117.55]|uniref:Uncharacterized protein n=1 Tax=Aspergillus heteromorphus CBS 117.55 TaxID=1448321 RepID=A0A317V8T4_9EURO|nr:uncharacterized protein BO70DRAFT_365409 [Aspergillus heteromorphus CBS 117.55]PWY70465.1 hypothetical protein BO70DRAFT_365409 [Aspergillus heteromorphus CBS 117.55]